MVMVLPVSDSVILVPAERVTSVLPEVLLDITDVLPVPAPTVRLPSFVADKSPPFARVIVLPVTEIVMPVPAVSVTSVLPEVLLDITDVLPVPAPTVRLPSFVVDRSPVFATVMVLVERVKSMPVPSARVTVPPESDKSRVYEVGPAPPALKVCISLLVERSPVLSMVTVPSSAVPPVVNAIPVPSINCTLPPEFDSVAVWVVAVPAFDRV
jgi:hypothetical protein